MSPKILNITNGDSAVNIMKEAKIEGDFLPWRDVLHVGPVPQGLGFEELSKIRVSFIKSQGWGDEQEIDKSFDERTLVMQNIARYEKVILWFEHDLYDQLQLLEILHWFSFHAEWFGRVHLICTDNYLGEVNVDELKALKAYEEEVTNAHYLLASKAWMAFTYPTPQKWQTLLEEDTTLFPFLEGSIVRLLEEYPSCHNGLSRTAQKALEIIASGKESRPGRVFGLYIQTEERRFLGDTLFWNILEKMLTSNPPLLNINMPLLPLHPQQHLALTEAGEEVLEGKKNWRDVHLLDEWIGGVHLNGNNVWCWNEKTQSIEHH